MDPPDRSGDSRRRPGNPGDQFEILQPHRVVRFGEHTYPASRTFVGRQGGLVAHVPLENGSLITVHGEPNGERYVLSANKFSVTRPLERTEEDRAHHVPIGSAYGAEDLHTSLQRLAKVSIDPDAVAMNRGIMENHRRLHNGDA